LKFNSGQLFASEINLNDGVLCTFGSERLHTIVLMTIH